MWWLVVCITGFGLEKSFGASFEGFEITDMQQNGVRARVLAIQGSKEIASGVTPRQDDVMEVCFKV